MESVNASNYQVAGFLDDPFNQKVLTDLIPLIVIRHKVEWLIEDVHTKLILQEAGEIF